MTTRESRQQVLTNPLALAGRCLRDARCKVVRLGDGATPAERSARTGPSLQRDWLVESGNISPGDRADPEVPWHTRTSCADIT
jgi:hypothetical protein